MNFRDPEIISFVNINLFSAHQDWVILAALFQNTWASRCSRLYRNKTGEMQPSNDGKPRNPWLVTILTVFLVNWVMKQGQLDAPIAKNTSRVSKQGEDGLEPISTVQISIPQLARYTCTNCGCPTSTLKTTRSSVCPLVIHGRTASQQKHKKELSAAFTITLH